MTSSEPLVIAHRGASGRAPENTLPAIEEAIDHDADFVEVDLQLTKDGEVVLLHDQTLNRTTDASEVLGNDVRIHDVTLDEVRRLDAGRWFGSWYARTGVPTLREALEVMDGQIGLWLELKSPHLHPGLEHAVAEVLRTSAGDWLEPDNCVATCFDPDTLDRFGVQVDHQVPLGQLVTEVPDDQTLIRTAERAEYLIPDCRRIQRGDLTRIRASGAEPACWTPNDRVTIASLLAQGMVGLITNYPRVAAEVIRGEYILSDRMAVELLIEDADGPRVVLRNLTAQPFDLTGWHLRDDTGDLVWTGPREEGQVAARGTAEITMTTLDRSTDSIALHSPVGELIDVAGRVPSPATGGGA